MSINLLTQPNNYELFSKTFTAEQLLNLPSLTSAERTTLGSVAEVGSTVYDNQTNLVYVWNGSAWISLAGGGGSGTVTSVASSTASTNVITLTGSPVTTSGTLGISLNGITALGTANQVLATNPGATALEWQTVSGGSGVSSVGNATSDTTLTIAGTGSGPYTGTVTAKVTDPLPLGTLNLKGNGGFFTSLESSQALSATDTYIWPAALGTSGNVLSTGGGNPQQLSWVSPTSGGTVTSVASSTASTNVITLTGSPVTTTGTLGVSLNGITALGTANQVLATNAGATAMEWQTVSGGSGVTSIAANASPDGIITFSAATGAVTARVADSLVLDNATINTNFTIGAGGSMSWPTGTCTASQTLNGTLNFHRTGSSQIVTLVQATGITSPNYTLTIPALVPTSASSGVLQSDSSGQLTFVNASLIGSVRAVTSTALNAEQIIIPPASTYNIFVKDVVLNVTTALTGGPNLIIYADANSNVICTFPMATIATPGIYRLTSTVAATFGAFYDAVISNLNIYAGPASGTFSAGAVNIMIEYITV